MTGQPAAGSARSTPSADGNVRWMDEEPPSDVSDIRERQSFQVCGAKAFFRVEWDNSRSDINEAVG